MGKLKLIQAGPAIFMVLFLMSSPVSAADLARAKTLLGEGRLQKALVVTNEVLAEDEKSIEARFVKGLILTKMNRLDDARDVFLGITRDHPELPEPYNNLAVIYAAKGEYEKARAALQNAINTHPSYATAHENLGDIFAKMASQAYNQALELDNSNETAREKLSLINDLFSAPSPETPGEEPRLIASKTGPAQENPEVPAAPAEEPEKAPEKTTAVTPEPPPAQVKKTAVEADPQQGEKTAVLQVVHGWRDAWSGQKVDAYLSYYADGFSPPDMTRSDWLEQRRERLIEPRFIKVELADEEVVMHGNDHAQVNFSQNYQSDTYTEQVRKTLLLKRFKNRWLIVQEDTN